MLVLLIIFMITARCDRIKVTAEAAPSRSCAAKRAAAGAVD